jgi:glycosyltransferase involved in cell wall biosynthesis
MTSPMEPTPAVSTRPLQNLPTSARSVSIITPVLNRREQLEGCLRSVAGQTHRAIEHIVVDGGSTDGTLELLEAHSDEIQYITGPDTGMYNAINKGLAMATGEVIGYLNSDDLYLPYSVEVATIALAGGADLVFGDLGILTREREPVGFYPQFYRDFDLNHYTHFATLAQPTVFWTRDLMERIGSFDETYKLVGDCEYWLRAAASGARITRLDEILAVQIEHAGTLRVTNPELLKTEFRRLRDQYRPAAGPPSGARLEHARRSIRWRYHQVRFAIEGRRRNPKRWPRFMTYLKEQGVATKPLGVLWYLLPQPIRPSNASLVNGPAIERVLLASGRPA